MAFVRPYKSTDEAAVLHIFRETASPELKKDPHPETLLIASFLWARPYIRLRPDWCTVIDDGNGKAVGYVLCAADTKSFVNDYKEYFIPYAVGCNIDRPDPEDKSLPANLRRLVYRPENMLHSQYPNLLSNYPAHLHVDILPSHQSAGFGKILIERLLERLKSAEILGIHLGMVADNLRAGKFYERLGFEPFAEMNENGQPGRKENAIYLVKKAYATTSN